MRSRHKCRSHVAGYSLVEMMMTLAVGLILVSVALPTMVGAIQSYRLNNAAQQVANLIELTRYTAIRHNRVVALQMAPVSGNTVFFIDLNGNGQPDANEQMVVVPSDMQIANAQCAAPTSAGADPGLTSTQVFPGQITFDYRGTVNFAGGGPTNPYFLSLGYATQAQFGCRAITVTQMGQTKVWKSPDGGPWSVM